MNTNLTTKQRQIMTVICEGKAGAGEPFVPVDMLTLLDRIDYVTTNHSMRFSIRALEARGLVVKQYEKQGHNRALFTPTELGKTLMGYAVPVSVIEADPDFSLACA